MPKRKSEQEDFKSLRKRLKKLERRLRRDERNDRNRRDSRQEYDSAKTPTLFAQSDNEG